MSKLSDLEKRRSSAAAEAAAAAVTEAETIRRPHGAKTASNENLPLSLEAIERTTLTIPSTLLEAVDARLARLSRRQRVSFSGYVEAALRELLARGDDDLGVLEVHGITKRRKLHGKTA